MVEIQITLQDGHHLVMKFMKYYKLLWVRMMRIQIIEVQKTDDT